MFFGNEPLFLKKPAFIYFSLIFDLLKYYLINGCKLAADVFASTIGLTFFIN